MIHMLIYLYFCDTGGRNFMANENKPTLRFRAAGLRTLIAALCC